MTEQRTHTGRPDEAETLLAQAAGAAPDDPMAIYLRGELAHRCGRFAEAIAHMKRACELAPQTALFHANLGETYRMAGEPSLAVQYGERAVELNPNVPKALSNLGLAYEAVGEHARAEACYHRAIAIAPDFAEAHYLIGMALHRGGKFAEAVGYMKRACDLAPQTALFHANLGETYRLAKQPDLAITHGERALALDPNSAEIWSNLGVAYYTRKHYAQAETCQNRALALAPDFAQAHCNLGNVFHAVRRFDEALACYRRAVEVRPDFSPGWGNMGTTLLHCGRNDEAIEMFRRAIALDPANANARSCLGMLLLMRGEMAQGWAEYEWRLQSDEVDQPYHPQNQWHGENLDGRSIFILNEQGLGDTIQFARYAPLLAARGAKVTLRVQQGLLALLRQSLRNIEVVSERDTPLMPADYECALLSLPRLLGTRSDTIPAPVPYLRADPAQASRWRERFAALRGLKVGIAWAGNPVHFNNPLRSIALTALEPLFAVPDASFVSLQVGPGAADAAREPDLNIVDCSNDLVDFAATAAAIEALDLVISIDSSVAHLAGALAKPVWLFVSQVFDWRWRIGREDSDWYPTMRLFRQAEGEPWSDVAARAAVELGKAVRGDPSTLKF